MADKFTVSETTDAYSGSCTVKLDFGSKVTDKSYYHYYGYGTNSDYTKAKWNQRASYSTYETIYDLNHSTKYYFFTKTISSRGTIIGTVNTVGFTTCDRILITEPYAPIIESWNPQSGTDAEEAENVRHMIVSVYDKYKCLTKIEYCMWDEIMGEENAHYVSGDITSSTTDYDFPYYFFECPWFSINVLCYVKVRGYIDDKVSEWSETKSAYSMCRPPTSILKVTKSSTDDTTVYKVYLSDDGIFSSVRVCEGSRADRLSYEAKDYSYDGNNVVTITSDYAYFKIECGAPDRSYFEITKTLTFAASSAIEDKIKPAYWDWTKSNGSANDEQTRKAYTAITNNGLISDFSHLVWNDLCSKLKEILDYRGDSWSTEYLSYENTRMDSGDYKIYASQMASMFKNSGLEVGFDIAKGKPILGSYITHISSRINYIIESSV